jgi:diaminohydroxyphosphoribosylaminopyrimidine deaminase / 5-amino-6-(5-phosphoribosylamino)uracil reductase
MSQFSEDDLMHMRRALELASRARGMTSPNPMVGAVIVKAGRVIGKGYHRAAGQSHAEIEALTSATEDVSGATLYVTLEPCSHQGRTPPCAPVLVERRIARVVVAATDPNPKVAGRGIALLRESGIQVDVGLCDHEARRENEAFFTFHVAKRPFIICKWAMTLDGRIAAQSGHSRWISNAKSREYAHRIRSEVDAVMVGIGTILIDNPRLDVRLEGYTGRQPRHVVVDGNLRIPLRAKCLEAAPPGGCIIATTDSAPKDKAAQLRDAGHQVCALKGRRGLVNLRDLIRELHRMDVLSLVCEGGGNLHGSLFEARLVDKIVAFVAPKIIGGETAKNPITGWGLPQMDKAIRLEDVLLRQFDDDVCIEGYIAGAARRLNPIAERTPAGEVDVRETMDDFKALGGTED